MAFKKGRSGNPKGRPKGAKGKAPAALVEQVRQLVAANFEQLDADIKNLPPVERVRAITKLLEFVLPKSNAVQIEAEVRSAVKQMSQAEAREFVQQLEKDY